MMDFYLLNQLHHERSRNPTVILEEAESPERCAEEKCKIVMQQVWCI